MVLWGQPVMQSPQSVHVNAGRPDRISFRVNALYRHTLAQAMQEWRQAQQELSGTTKSEWSVILELLRRTDQSLLERISRKMLNHLGSQNAVE